MKNIVKQNKQFLLAFFGVLLIILSCSIFVSNSDMLTEEVVIKSIVPVYDENDTYSVGNTGVIFNDKEQVVKYNIVVENTRDYDVKITDLQLSTPTEDFLNYTVENIELDDVIKANETKELVVSFETVKMDGWGRNFNDELVTTLVFDEVKKQEEVVTPPVVDTKPDTNVPTNKVENNTSNNVQPEVNEPVVNEPVIEQPKEEVKDDVVITPEEDANHELGMNQEIIVKDAHPEDAVVIFCFGIATGVLGIGLVMVNKNKFTKYIVLFVIVGSSVKLASANEIMSLEIPINVSYESQTIMMDSPCHDFGSDGIGCPGYYWYYSSYIKGFYIENELNEIENYVEKYDMSENESGSVVVYLVDDGDFYNVHLQGNGIIYLNDNALALFGDMINLDFIDNMHGIDTSNVTDMRLMFMNTGRYSEIFTLDVSNFDTSKVTNMKGMFWNTGSNSTNFTLDVSNFDTSNVISMYQMFYNTGYNSPNFNTSITIKNPNVVDYDLMFYTVAAKSGSQITVNYTAETEALVDQMIATKTNDSNVVKGWNVDYIISFDITDLEGQTTTYNAIEDMTWEEWIDSEFNTDGYYIKGSRIAKSIENDNYVVVRDITEESDARTYSEIMREHTYKLNSPPPV